MDPVTERIDRYLAAWDREINRQPLHHKENREMAYDLPQGNFKPHPDGAHTGYIKEVRDQGIKETKFGEKHKLSIIIESETAYMEDGQPFTHWEWVTLSGGSKARLTELRQWLLRRPLTDDEKARFDPDREMVGRAISYVIISKYAENGNLVANLATWSPLDSGPPPAGPRQQAPAQPHPAQAARERVQGQQSQGPRRPAPQRPAYGAEEPPIEAYADAAPPEGEDPGDQLPF